ncbi:MAG TPA: ATP-binding protein [Solirubrobacter sp.]|nr:ATP-binding protein [Solirubrobacter sp.]
MPLRFKLTLAFTGVMAVLLTAAGIALSVLVAGNLDSTIDDGLAARAGDAAAVVANGRLARTGEPFAQVLGPGGQVLDTTTLAGRKPLLPAQDLARAREGVVIVDRVERANVELRLLARPVRVGGAPAVLVVGESLAQRERALDSLHALLLIGGPLALLIASAVGYALAAAALRPVERMRRRAAAVTAAATSGRLPVPPADDEIGRLGRTLNEMLARLEVAFKRERAFVSDASHELRTPLSILRTELELALRGEHTREELEAALRSAAEETDRLSQLADDLLVIARSDQGRLPVRPEPLEAGPLLAKVAGRFQTRAKSEGRPLAAAPSPGVALTADPARLEQALANLVDNALRYGDGTVELSARTADGHVELHVSDEGPGFPPDFLPRAFERFTRADEARSRGGTGLGLAIAAAIAQALGGSAHAANGPDGADVWLTLPVE